MLFFERFRQIALLCLTVFGCTGNILTLVVVNQQFFRKTISADFISALSVTDCLVLCLQSFQIVTKLHPRVTSYDCIVLFLMDVFRLLSLWIVCFINLERCSLVFNPCRIPRLTSRVKSRVFVFILFLISLLIFSHYAKHMHIKYVYVGNGTVPLRSYCAFKPNFDRVRWEFIKSALTYWFTVPLCIVCNLIIIQRLHRASRIERKLANENSNQNHVVINTNKLDLSSKQRQLTAMLVTSSICFILTATPSTIHTTYILIKSKTNNVHYIIHIITNIILHVHHASNFIAFIFSCARFRTELMQFFRRHLRCQIYLSWSRRSIPNTEQALIYSSKQKTAIKLLNSKPKEQKPNIQPQYHNGMVILGVNKCKNNDMDCTKPFI